MGPSKMRGSDKDHPCLGLRTVLPSWWGQGKEANGRQMGQWEGPVLTTSLPRCELGIRKTSLRREPGEGLHFLKGKERMAQGFSAEPPPYGPASLG